MPSLTDSYFPPEDCLEEIKGLKQGELKVIESVWGTLLVVLVRAKKILVLSRALLADCLSTRKSKDLTILQL